MRHSKPAHAASLFVLLCLILVACSSSAPPRSYRTRDGGLQSSMSRSVVMAASPAEDQGLPGRSSVRKTSGVPCSAAVMLPAELDGTCAQGRLRFIYGRN
jgi:hypothetical protein